MTKTWTRAALLAGFTLAGLSATHAQEALRPEVGKPLVRARQLMAARNYAGAMAQVRAASAVRGLSANESFIVEEMRGSIAQASGDVALASKTYADMLASGKVPPAEQLKLFMAEASMQYQLKNYAEVARWTQKYFAAGGRDPAMRNLLIQAYYLQKDYANAAKLQKAQIDQTIAAHQKPTEQQLQLLARCQQEMGDSIGFGNTMTQLVVYYPKPDYWLNLIHSARTRPGFNSLYDLDIDRFELATGLLTKPADLMEMVELALQVPVPGEAKAITDQAFTAGTLGSGPEATRQQRLRTLVDATYASELKALPAKLAAAQATRDGNLLVSLGEEYCSYGKFDEGIALIQQGIKKGELRHPDQARLHLGLAYMKAGKKAQAIQTLRMVGGKEGAAEIARLWLVQMQSQKA